MKKKCSLPLPGLLNGLLGLGESSLNGSLDLGFVESLLDSSLPSLGADEVLNDLAERTSVESAQGVAGKSGSGRKGDVGNSFRHKSKRFMRIMTDTQSESAHMRTENVDPCAVYAHKSCMAKKAHNTTLNPDVAEAFKTVVLPRTKFRSLSDWLNNELLKATRARAGELRAFKGTATREQQLTIDRALKAAFETE
jgi:hypothetical protein